MPPAKSFCSEARGSAFSYTSIYFMTSLQRRLSFSHEQLGGFQLATIHRESREVTTADRNIFLSPSPTAQVGTFSHLCKSTGLACQMIPISLHNRQKKKKFLVFVQHSKAMLMYMCEDVPCCILTWWY